MREYGKTTVLVGIICKFHASAQRRAVPLVSPPKATSRPDASCCDGDLVLRNERAATSEICRCRLCPLFLLQGA